MVGFMLDLFQAMMRERERENYGCNATSQQTIAPTLYIFLKEKL